MAYQNQRDSFSWASYVYYGDPRLEFTPLGQEVALPPPAPARAPQSPPQAAAADRALLDELAQEYEQIRSSMPFGPERTRRMEEILVQASELAAKADYRDLIGDLFGPPEGPPPAERAGRRVVALGLIEGRPDPQHLDLVLSAAERPLSAFEQYHALTAARLLVDALDDLEAERLRQTLTKVSRDAAVVGTDRGLLARDILGRLGPTAAGQPPVGVVGGPPRAN